MSINATQQQLAAVSTFASKRLLRAENMGTFTTSLGDMWVDPLDPALTKIIEKLSKDLEQITYVSGTPLTTISFERYDTTSAWWLILYINGYMHENEISDGAPLKVPSVAAIEALSKEIENNVGKRVIV